MVDSTTITATHPHEIWPEFVDRLDHLNKITVVQNKIDKSDLAPGYIHQDDASPCPVIRVSAKQGAGLNILKQHLKQCMGFSGAGEGSFSARRRHINALEQALINLSNGRTQLKLYNAGELLAEDLKQAQQALSEITGAFTNDDLLGEIFSSFCIGK